MAGLEPATCSLRVNRTTYCATLALSLGDGLGGSLHDGGVHTVAGEGQNTGLGAGGDQKIVVGEIGELVPVVELHSAHGSGKDGQIHLVTEEVIRGVHGEIVADGVHIDTQLLPLLIVADGAGADALGTGAGHGVFAGKTVAGGAGFAQGTHAGAGICQNFLIRHREVPPFI